LPVPIPEEFGPLNWGHHALPPPLSLFCAAAARLDRTMLARTAIEERRVIGWELGT
jgi:hypothetical protein